MNISILLLPMKNTQNLIPPRSEFSWAIQLELEYIINEEYPQFKFEIAYSDQVTKLNSRYIFVL